MSSSVSLFSVWNRLPLYFVISFRIAVVSLIGILKKSKHMKSPISQRGKTTMTHGKGKRKKR